MFFGEVAEEGQDCLSRVTLPRCNAPSCRGHLQETHSLHDHDRNIVVFNFSYLTYNLHSTSTSHVIRWAPYTDCNLCQHLSLLPTSFQQSGDGVHFRIINTSSWRPLQRQTIGPMTAPKRTGYHSVEALTESLRGWFYGTDARESHLSCTTRVKRRYSSLCPALFRAGH